MGRGGTDSLWSSGKEGCCAGFAAQPILEEAVISLGCEVVSHTYAVLQPQYIERLALDARHSYSAEALTTVETDLL